MTDLLPARVTAQIELAKTMSHSNLLPRQYQGQPANLLWAVQYAEALGVHPMTAVTGIHVIEGKPTASAQLIGGLVRRAGHKLRVTFDKATSTAVAQIIRSDDPEFTFESIWSLERAKAAGLTGKKVWSQYPDAMLKARAITEVARDACPEALFGVIYTAEELGQDGTVSEAGDFEPANVPASRPSLMDPDLVEPITEQQLKAIHALAADLELTDEQYRAGLQRLAGVDSSKQLSKATAAIVIDALRESKATRTRIEEEIDAEIVEAEEVLA